MNLLRKSLLAASLVLTTAQAQAQSLKAVKVNCGDTITESVTILNDLNCPTTTGYALNIVGDNITVNGSWHKINAPKASAAIHAQGSGIKITKFTTTGNGNGFGVMGYNTPKLQISDSDFSNNRTGISLYADKVLVDGVVIERNRITGSIDFGVRMNYSGSGMIKSPKITENDFRNTGSTAVHINASEFEITGTDNNNFWGSKSAYYLVGGTFYIHDIDFSQQLIYKTTIFVDSAKYIHVKNVNVSSRAVNMCTEERIGLDFYRAIKFLVENMTSTSGDVGLVLETEKGVQTDGDVVTSTYTNHVRSGIFIVSHDTTSYGTVTVDTTGFCEPRKDIYVAHGTKGRFVHIVQPTICPDNINYSCKPDVPDIPLDPIFGSAKSAN